MSRQTEATKQIDNTVLEYLKAATASSDRARAVLIVMITASVLVFTVIWNTGGWSKTGGGWLDARIELREAALEYFNPAFDPARSSVADEDRELYGRAENFLELRGLDRNNPEHKDRLKTETEELNKIRTEQIRIIRVPFFGVVFDMNDLGLFAGITFTVVLLWLTFSLARERRNLKIAFNEASEREQKKLCYDLLAMHQMLTVPPMHRQRFGWVWNFVPKLLYLIPAAVYLMQFKTDWDSRPIGYLLSPTNMKALVRANVMLLSLILVFTVLCVILSFGTDKIWRAAFKEAYPVETGEEGRAGASDGAAPLAQVGDAV
ncbi:MAG TPA: hypothetical protein VF588_03210 [Pyrinomonadaceae bacterium]|jgi:hypothetical protein